MNSADPIITLRGEKRRASEFDAAPKPAVRGLRARLNSWWEDWLKKGCDEAHSHPGGLNRDDIY